MKLKNKFPLLLIFVFLFNSNLFSQNSSKEFNWNISLNFGCLFGQTNELLNYMNEDVRLSQLDWNVEIPVFNLEGNLNYKNFILGFSGETSFPVKSGVMKDYDWLNWDYYKTHELSYFSCHDNYLDYYYKLGADFGYNFIINNLFIIKPYINLKTEGIKFTAKDGYTQYAPFDDDGKRIWTESLPKKNVYGSIITYLQTINSAGIGINTVFSPQKAIILELNPSFNIINYVSYDFHCSRNQIFADEILIGISYDLTAKSKFFLNDYSSLNIIYKCQFIPEQIGSSYNQECSQWNTWENGKWFLQTDSQGGIKKLFSTFTLGYELYF